MSVLCISFTFLDNLYHGQSDHGPEWPPSPMRVFQGLLASAGSDACKDAFSWLELQSPPIILTPSAETAQKRTVYVPNNTNDVKLDKKVAKTFAPSRIVGKQRTLHYCWVNVNPLEVVIAYLLKTAHGVTQLGWGIDLVVADVRLLTAEAFQSLKENYPGLVYIPVNSAGLILRVPVPGTLNNLQFVYQTQVSRFKGSFYTPAYKPTVFDTVGYVREGLAYRPVACFKLRQPESESPRFLSIDARDVILPASWVRSKLSDLARDPNMDYPGENPEIEIAGHVPEGKSDTPFRLSFLPLPTIGHEHTDGRVRRLIVSEPFGGSGEIIQWVRRVLHNELLTDSNGKECVQLECVRHDADVNFRQYTKHWKTFESVTPVVLPGTDRKSYPRAERLFLKAVIQAGLDVELVESFLLKKAPFFPGGYHPMDYRRPRKHMGHYSIFHAKVTFKKEQGGPLALGPGRHRGLGLFLPV